MKTPLTNEERDARKAAKISARISAIHAASLDWPEITQTWDQALNGKENAFGHMNLNFKSICKPGNK